MRFLTLLMISALFLSCAENTRQETPREDAEVVSDLAVSEDMSTTPQQDSMIIDAHLPDAELPDSAIHDLDIPDAEAPDAEFIDAEVIDAEFIDAEVFDAEFIDAEVIDAEFIDAEFIDAEFIDAEFIDAEFIDAEVFDAEVPDQGPIEPIYVEIRGLVIDSTGEPIERATVFSNLSQDQQLTTDSMGYYSLTVELNERQVITFKAAGKVPQHLIVTPKTHAQIFNVTLVDIAPPVPISSDLGGRAESLGAAVTIPPDSLIDSTGQPVTGVVNVELTPFDVTTDQIAFMPGDYTGIDENGEDIHMESFGFVKIRVMQGEEELQLQEGAMATLDVPIAAAQVATSPDQIPLWNFDEELGTWIQKGVAVKLQLESGQWVYRGELVSFGSFWNCDQVMEVVNLAFFIGDLALWLFPGTFPYKAAFMIASKGYKIFSLLKTISEIGPNGPTLEQSLQITKTLLGLSGRLNLNPLEDLLIGELIGQVGVLETQWRAERQAIAQNPDTWLAAHQIDRSLTQLSSITERQQLIADGGSPPNIIEAFETATTSLSSSFTEFQNTDFEQLRARTESLGLELTQVAEIQSLVQAIDLNDAGTAQNITRSIAQVDHLFT